ncbi:MAG: ADP-forming succinate--CoA ligase subunit beta [Acidobacteriia bacterium]|nr:ADP-forming succinate--CoA ligase subunit beta [Terriglobia bacterium]
MDIHEYQAKQLLAKYGVAVPVGDIAYKAHEAENVAKWLDEPIMVVKAQIHAGGRGKAGGVKIVRSVEEAIEAADKMFNMRLVTHQTGPEGRSVHRVYIESGVAYDKELYFSILNDRETAGITLIASTEGGMDIEEVAEKTPDKIIKVRLGPAAELQPHHARSLSYDLGLKGKTGRSAQKLFMNVFRAFLDLDATLLEINPLVTTKAGDVMALDCKMSFDDNALWRHRDIEELRDDEEIDPLELEAARHDLNYVKLPGSIGLMVNGAGLSMATMDILKYYGGSAANFLDVAGAATPERVAAAFKLIYSDPGVKGILLNIFGGMMRCNSIAEGLVNAAREVGLNKPLVVRLEGTNVELGREILEKSGLPIQPVNTMGEAAKKIVDAVKGL